MRRRRLLGPGTNGTTIRGAKDDGFLKYDGWQGQQQGSADKLKLDHKADSSTQRRHKVLIEQTMADLLVKENALFSTCSVNVNLQCECLPHDDLTPRGHLVDWDWPEKSLNKQAQSRTVEPRDWKARCTCKLRNAGDKVWQKEAIQAKPGNCRCPPRFVRPVKF
eukprot:jgi/Chrzof1/2884/Cz12g02220.t1